QKVAAPMNAQRLHSKTPCAITGKCENCNSPERICRAMTIYFRPMLSFDETWVILIKEPLGF
ncbi:MAG: lactate utilization protein, partial [Oscillospiraceae bacterium]